MIFESLLRLLKWVLFAEYLVALFCLIHTLLKMQGECVHDWDGLVDCLRWYRYERGKKEVLLQHCSEASRS